MSFDANRVRIELCDVMSFGNGALTTRQAADIWLASEPGKIARSRKPALTIVDDTRAGVLRQIADWLDANDDPGLMQLARDVADARNAAVAR